MPAAHRSRCVGGLCAVQGCASKLPISAPATRPPPCAALSMPGTTNPSPNIKPENAKAPPNNHLNSPGSTCLRSRHKNASKAPYRLNTAPDAPPDTARLPCTTSDNKLPSTPLPRYSSSKRQGPSSRSTSRPTSHSAHMFTARCTMPKCMNNAVASRHHCPSCVAGPKLAPQASCTPLGVCHKPAPASNMATNTSTLTATRLVTTGAARAGLRIRSVRATGRVSCIAPYWTRYQMPFCTASPA